MSLATTTDVSNSLGHSLTSDQNLRATSLLILASAFVTTHTGFRFASGTYTIGRCLFERGKVKIPAGTPTGIAVRQIDPYTGTATTLTLATDYTVRGRMIYGVSGDLEIDFTTNAAVPPVIVNLVAGMVAATMGGPATGVQSETAGAFAVSYVASSGKVFLSASDKAILGPWIQSKSAIVLA